MNDFKRCSKCGNEKFLINFHKPKKFKHGLNSIFKLCRKSHYTENLVKIKKFYLEKRDKIVAQQNEHKIKKYRTDNNFRLIKKTRNRIYQALKGRLKSSSTIDILGMDIDTYRKWIEFQMTPEMNWSEDIYGSCEANLFI